MSAIQALDRFDLDYETLVDEQIGAECRNEPHSVELNVDRNLTLYKVPLF